MIHSEMTVEKYETSHHIDAYSGKIVITP